MRIILINIFILFSSFYLTAQENDFQLWLKSGVECKINKKVTVEIKEGIRFRENSQIIDKTYTNTELLFKKNKVRFKIGYRFTQNFDEQIYNVHRFYNDYLTKLKIQKYTFDFRIRFQQQKELDHLVRYCRGKIALSYNGDFFLTPSIIHESFYSLESDKIDKFRYTFLFKTNLLKRIKLSLYYRIQNEFRVANPKNLYIVGSSIIYGIN